MKEIKSSPCERCRMLIPEFLYYYIQMPSFYKKNEVPPHEKKGTSANLKIKNTRNSVYESLTQQLL